MRSEHKWRNDKKSKEIDTSDINKWCKKVINNYQTNPYMFDNHIRPQSEFYFDGCDVYDFKDISTIQYKLSEIVPITIGKMPHMHKKPTPFRFNDDSKDLIRNFYKSDYDFIDRYTLL